MQHLVGSGTPVLYIGRTVLKGKGQAVNSDNAKFNTKFYVLPTSFVSFMDLRANKIWL
jgi:hypothetical protein